MSEQDAPFVIQPILEEPPTPEQPAGRDGMLSSDGIDHSFHLAGKLSALESFLALTVRDQTFDDFMRDLLLVVMKVVRSEAGSIFEYDHENNTLFFRSAAGQASDTIKKFTIPAGKGIVGHVAESRKPVLVTNVEENRQHLKTIQDAVGFEARNLVAVPILIRGRIFGVLELLNRLGEENYTQGDLDVLSYLCDAAAKAIEARLTLAWALQRSRESGTAA